MYYHRLSQNSFGYLFYRPSKNVVFVERRGVFPKRELICKEDSRSTIDLEEIQELNHEGTSEDARAQPGEEMLVAPVDKSIPLRRSTRVRMKPELCGFQITIDGDTFISDSKLVNLDEPTNYK